MPDETDLIEAGAAGDTIELWCAQQALRLSELRLKEQLGEQDSLLSRATSLLGWTVSIALAAVATWINTPALRAPAGTALVAALLAALCAAIVLWPRAFQSPYGTSVAWLLDVPETTELRTTQAIARQNAELAASNHWIAQDRAWWLRAAAVLALLIPFAAAAGQVAVRAAGSAGAVGSAAST